MPVSSADRERLLLPTKATPKALASKHHAFGWNARVRPGSVAVSITRALSSPGCCASASSSSDFDERSQS